MNITLWSEYLANASQYLLDVIDLYFEMIFT